MPPMVTFHGPCQSGTIVAASMRTRKPMASRRSTRNRADSSASAAKGRTCVTASAARSTIVSPGKSVDSGRRITWTQPQTSSSSAAKRRPATSALNSLISPIDRFKPVGVAQDRLIAVQNRNQQQSGSEKAGTDGCQLAKRPARHCEPEQPQRKQHRQEKEEVAARERLEEPGDGSENGPTEARGATVSVQRGEADRREVRRDDLDVRHLRDPIGRKRKRHARDEGGIVPLRQRERQVVRRHPAEHKGRKERDVVAEHRLVCDDRSAGR